MTANFGQKPFKFPPPDGFQPLNAANVRPETVIARPDQYVGISTWSGDNVDDRFIDMERNLTCLLLRLVTEHIEMDDVCYSW